MSVRYLGRTQGGSGAAVTGTFVSCLCASAACSAKVVARALVPAFFAAKAWVRAEPGEGVVGPVKASI